MLLPQLCSEGISHYFFNVDRELIFGYSTALLKFST